MDLSKCMSEYADQIGGQFTQYDKEHSVIIIPVTGGRFQNVSGTIFKNTLNSRELINFHSKICPVPFDHINFKTLLEESASFNYCRFVISQNYLQIEAITPIETLWPDILKEMLKEIADLADQYEMALTNSDIH